MLSAMTLVAVTAGACDRPTVAVPAMSVEAAAAATGSADRVADAPTAAPAPATTDSAGPVTDSPAASPAPVAAMQADPVVITTSPTVPPAPDGTGIPPVVLGAYRAAAGRLAATQPWCRLSWTLLAGIGQVESGHASAGRVDGFGTTLAPIIGPPLDGSAGVAAVADSDGGALDGDGLWDRAVGPMQVVPRTWRRHATDGNGDGVASPHNVFDAALTAGTYLCAGGGDLGGPAAQRAALLRYNSSTAYVTTVLRWAAAYGAGTAALPPLSDVRPGASARAPVPAARTPTPAAPVLPGPVAPAPIVIAPGAPAPAVGGPVAPVPVVTTAEPLPEPQAATRAAPRPQPSPTSSAPVRTRTAAPTASPVVTATSATAPDGTPQATAAPVVTAKVGTN